MSSSIKTVYAISGFLGQTSDWDLIADLLPSGWTLKPVDLWQENRLIDFDAWAESFCEHVNPSETNVLLGYSMGGRLALHALAKHRERFSGAVIVSANPGLVSEDERSLRRKTDEIWAVKFLKEPWAQLVQEWNAQTVLRPPKTLTAESITIERRESDFDRKALAQALRIWSLGMQRNLRPEIDQIQIPIEFVTGQEDVKFTHFTRDWIKTSSLRKHVIVPNAGHRVPWDAPIQFRAILAKFLSRW